MKRILLNLWKVLWAPLLFIGMQIVCWTIYIICVEFMIVMRLSIESAVAGTLTEIMNDPEALGNLVYSSVNEHIPVIMTGISTIIAICLIMRKQWNAESFWSFKKTKPSPVLLGFSLGASLNLLFIGVMSFLPIPEEYAEQPVDSLIDNNLPLMFLSLVLFAAITEEMIFRGIVQKRLVKFIGVPSGIIIQAVIFGAVHMHLLQGSYAAVLGLIIGIVYFWHDSIWVPMIIHFAFNLTSVVLTQIEISMDLFGVIIMTAGALIVSAGSFIELYRGRTGGESHQNPIL